jgi:AraC-like DNA-binding protein
MKGATMHATPQPLLERLRIFRSCSADETRAFLHGKQYRFDVGRKDAGALDARINGVYLPGGYLGYVQYGGALVSLSPGLERSDYWIQLPLHGRLNAVLDREEIACDPSRAAIASPSHEHCSLVSEPDSSRLQFALTSTAVHEVLADLLGDAPTSPLVFAPAFDLAGGYGQSLARYILMAVADLDRPNSVLLEPATTRAFVQFVVTALLQSHRHSYSEALHRRCPSIAPRDVKRAVDYIEANIERAIGLSDIIRASGVPGRTLFGHFRNFKGLTPMQYLRNSRYQKARQALLRADPDGSVTEIALGLGFSHLGRFACEYRQRFGESPSESLRRPRRSASTSRRR